MEIALVSKHWYISLMRFEAQFISQNQLSIENVHFWNGELRC